MKRFLLELCLAALVVLLFSRYLFSSDLLYGTDAVPSGIFFRGLLVDFVKAHGELPRWNPYILGGLPFLDATHGDTFFPTSLLQYVLPVYRALGHKLIVHIFVAGALMAFYLRSLRLHSHAVAVGSLTYMLTPVLVSYLFAGQDGKMYVTSLTPLVLGTLERAMRSGRLSTFLGLGLAIGLTILSAQIQMAYHLLWFVGALFLIRLCLGGGAPATESRPGRVRLGALFVLSVTLGVLIASIQLFPAVSYVKNPAGFSVRSTKTDYEHASSWSLHPEEVASMVVPEFCPAPRGYWGRNVFKYNSDYLGIVTMLLAVVALARRRDATRIFLGSLVVFCVLYSLGGWTPLHRLFYWIVPQVKLFRAPPLVMFGAAFGASALAAHAVHDLETIRRSGDSALARRLLTIGLSAAALIALAGLAASSVTSFWTDLLRVPLDEAKRNAQRVNLPHFREGALIAAALLAAGTTILVARLRGRLGAVPVTAILLVLIGLDLWRIDQQFVTIVDPSPWVRPQGVLAQVARESREEKFRVMPVVRGLAANELGCFDIESTLGFHDNELAWYRELRTASESKNLLASNETGYPLLRALNVKYILHDSPEYPNPLPVPGVVPRFRVVDRYDVAPSRDRIVPMLLDPAHDTATQVILEEDPGFPSAPASPSPPGRVVGYEYDGNVIRADIQADRPLLLVHTENWFPYWHAYEGTDELPILRADGAMRAVPLAVGRHEIEFRFRSTPYEIGKWVTIGTLLAIGAALLVDRRAGRSA
ncbi:hypothetical protein K8I85_06900 [bacterium]|nr:hypothetical protein [bacterium]